MNQNYEYALIFRNHQFEYEVHAISKLFVPDVRFRICADGVIPEDVPNTILTEIGDGMCRVVIDLHGKQREASALLREGDAEYSLCHLLYFVLKEMTGYTPPWGMLTGIRPVRKVVQLMDTGKTADEACGILQDRYRISDEKLRLARETALVQYPILPHNRKEIGLYVSIPFCPTRCSYCSFVSHSIESAGNLIPAYVEKLCDEIRILGEMIRRHDLSVQSVYIGGGTPTTLTAEQMRTLMEAIAQHIDIADAREYTVEAGRPDTITEDKLRVIRDLGATPISVNPQTLQDSVLEAIGRRHTSQQTIDAFRIARDLGFDDINMDLIAGLPTDTYEGFCDTLQRVMALQPDSITVHTLTLKRAAELYGTSHAERVHAVESMVDYSAKHLAGGGYRPYYMYRQKNTIGNLENIGYAKPGKENLYNILIMDETQTILGAGCGASTKLVEENGRITRVHNYKFPYEYIQQFDKLMEKKQTIEEILLRMENEYAEEE